MGITATGRRRNRSWPEALKREIVAASFAPGASVSVVARHYDVNANQVFSWRRLYRDKPFGGPAPPAAVFYYSRDRAGEHPQAHLATYTGIFQADAYTGYG